MAINGQEYQRTQFKTIQKKKQAKQGRPFLQQPSRRSLEQSTRSSDHRTIRKLLKKPSQQRLEKPSSKIPPAICLSSGTSTTYQTRTGEKKCICRSWFSFGAKPATTTSSGGGFTFGTPNTTATPSGLLGQTPATTQQTAGFNFASPAPALGTPATTATATTQATGFTLGGVTPQTTAASTGFSFGGTPAATTTAAAGFSLTGAATTKPGGLLGTTPLGATPASTATLGSGFGLAATSTATTSSTLGTGFSFGKAATTSATAPGGLGLGLGSALSTGGSIFGQTAAKTTVSGLGGVDPKTTTATTAASADGAKSSDGKTVKEAQVQNEILVDIDNFKKYVKKEKSETEHIKRMSSTPMLKVQEDISSLKQLLSVVSNGLQRNSCAVLKLKSEMSQELKNAEMAMRTKDIPAGLQYENTAPTEYFQRLVEDFESQMLNYRQQIEMLENHLASAHQPNRLTAEELVILLRKLHETFVAMAAQLQQVHENIKTQKDHYLNYRKVFLGDNKNIFERQKKAPVKAVPVRPAEHYGQNPFPGVNNSAAVAMASVMTRTQQPQTQLGTGPPVTGFGFGQQSTTGGLGFGASTTQASTGFKGFGTGSSLFATPASQPQSAFNLSASVPTGQAMPQPNLSSATEQPFQLNKPPLGMKRGKR